jgi:hypothetical protein
VEDLSCRNKLLEDKTKEWKAKLLADETINRPEKTMMTPDASGDYGNGATLNKKIFDLEKENEYLKVSHRILIFNNNTCRRLFYNYFRIR